MASSAVARGEGSIPASLVDTERRPPSNRILEKAVFTNVSKSKSLVAVPGVVHFGGFNVDQTHVLTLRLVNHSSKALRTHIIPPNTPFFTIRCNRKQRFVPGLSEDVIISFTPNEHRYYYDVIRVQVEDGENLLVPVHAYPVVGASGSSLPPRVDFGAVPLGETRTRSFPLDCTVPIDFEYRVNVLEANPCFQISPASGTIPAKGTTTLEVSYTPQRFATVSSTFELELSQLHSKPVRCTLTGSCAPGLLKDQHVMTLTSSGLPGKQATSASTSTSASTVAATSTAATPSSASSARRASTPGSRSQQPSAQASPRPPPPGSRSDSRSASRRRGGTGAAATAVGATARGVQTTPGTTFVAGLGEAVVVDGVTVPTSLKGMAAINYVMNQPPAVAADAQNALRELGGRRALREEELLVKFRQQAAGKPQLGHVEITNESRRAVLDERHGALQAYLAVRGQGPLMEQQALQRAHTTVGTALQRTQRVVTVASNSDVVTAAGDHDNHRQQQQHPDTWPALTFRANPGKDLPRQIESLSRFIKAVRTVIIQLRASRGKRRQQGLASAGTQEEITLAAAQFKPEQVVPFRFPVYEETHPIYVPEQSRQPVEAATPRIPPSSLTFLDLQAPVEHQLLGYQVGSFWDAAVCIEPEPERQLRQHPNDISDEVYQLAQKTSGKRAGSRSSTRATSRAADRGIRQKPLGMVVTEEGDGDLGQDEANADMPLPSTLQPPGWIVQPPLKPLCIYDPLPEVVAYESYLEDVETQPGHWLRPLTLDDAFPATVSRNGSIEPNSVDVCPALMTVRDCDSSASSLVLGMGPSLSNYWVPRMSNPFGALLPANTPELLEPAALVGIPADGDDDALAGLPASAQGPATASDVRSLLLGDAAFPSDMTSSPRSNNPMGPRGRLDEQECTRQLELALGEQRDMLGTQVVARYNALRAAFLGVEENQRPPTQQ
eukprot:m.223783 g.223783  ORF g.223783 m.223783 type:complete len:951 (-) comp18759_c0_seq1:27-2879(-)